MHLIQFEDDDGARAVAMTDNGATRIVNAESVYALALEATDSGRSLAEVVQSKGLGPAVDREVLARDGRLLSPIDHPDPAHLLVTGTGLTHLGSASTRD